MKILITGSTGYIGRSLTKALEDNAVTAVCRQNFDLCCPFQTAKFFKNKFFDVVIHCSIQGGSRLKIDPWKIMDNNLRMYYNLLECRGNFSKLISFGSGAELNFQSTPYGLSKYVIRNSMLEIKDFYNLRLYAVFDENELSTRFIKSSILNYLAGDKIHIIRNKKMDFFYMKDLISVVKQYIDRNDLPKEINCNYDQTVMLSDIANMINQLGSHKVPIVVSGTHEDLPYCGEFTNIGINYIGLEKGIKSVFEKIKDNN
jgi:nucleoside-diphosphate-sugar epimerase